MDRRQTMPEQWLILSELDDAALNAVRRLRRSTGIIVIGTPAAAELRRLQRIAAARGVTVAVEGRGDAERVHNLPELRTALLRRTPLVLLSPMFPTRSHPDWPSIPLMRAAALARLADRKLLALGGMNARRYAKIAPLGFIGWAGISAFRT
jgi:thiamine-phosphate pyrophosphorylase